ncbi:MAG TPA: DUF3568 family protein [Candidatus Omnitrophota bacterium]|nr:DUF3568 family protein [Candidatus Omnitrophota bacterium]HPD85498.1 DUF3568 family protein [Candidatus Omnitrophota bacterium]HRZ04001.1 DUF3568 family protein [Candidatus Omnitrophota bacterium]
MSRKIVAFVGFAFLLLTIYGCVAIVAGAVGGVGTSVWLSGKLTQEFNTPYEKTIKAARSALQSLKLNITKETKDDTVAQLRSEDSSGKDIWVDIRKITETSTRVEVRVGAVNSDKDAATTILQRIQKYL